MPNGNIDNLKKGGRRTALPDKIGNNEFNIEEGLEL